MAAQLILRKDDFFASASQAVTVADRYPQDVFAEHTHEFCELVLVWRGNGLHILNDRPYRITRGDLFYIRADDKHSYASVNDLVLQNVIYCPDRLKLNVDWAASIPGFLDAKGSPHWRLSSSGMAQVRQVISQLEQESQKNDPVANQLAELLFAQLVMTLKRHRYATDNPSATTQEALLDKLITRLAGSLNKNFVLEKFCEQELTKAKIRPNIMVDCSHANSNKDPALQPLVMENVANQILEGNNSIVGLMVESHLGWGSQAIPKNLCDLKYGVSITDACIDWDTTEKTLRSMHAKLKDVLPKRQRG